MINPKDLKNGDFVEGQLAVRSKDGPGEGLREYSNKKGKFFVMTLGNSLGDITLKYWGGGNSDNASQLYSAISVGDAVNIKGKVIDDSYSKSLVISVNEETKYGNPEELLEKAGEGDYRAEEFLPSLSKEEIGKCSKKLDGFVKAVKNPHLKALLDGFFCEGEFRKIFEMAPAAKKHHHNYVGGLLEHSVNVAGLCTTICDYYALDRDLLIAGALLHDIGKTEEYDVKTSIDISEKGRFVGHLMLSTEIVLEKISSIPDFPENLKNKIIHMILSHHGELEYGSPKEPAFPEAMALFHADYMDAFVKNTLQELEGIEESEEWMYSRSMKRFLHKPSNSQ